MAARRPALFAVTAFVLLVTGTAIPATAVGADDPTIRAFGQLLVVSDEGLDLTVAPGESPAHELHDELSYSVVTDGGQVIAVDGHFDDGVKSGDTFEGTLVVPDEIAEELSVEPDAVVAADSNLGTAIVELAAESDTPLVVESAEVQTVPVASAMTPVAHSFDVAVVTVGGSDPGMSDSQVESLVDAVGNYWINESDGGISSFTKPLDVQRYLSAGGCASSELNRLWTEAAGKFGGPTNTVNAYFGSARHLVVILPASCAVRPNVGVGIGTIGAFHSGGLSIVSNRAGIAAPILAHEIGHNIGLGHANASYCETSSHNEGLGCSTYEYLDIYGVMGLVVDNFAALPALPAPQRDRILGYSAGELVTQPLAGGNPNGQVTYTLLPATDTSGLRAIKATDPITGRAYYIELRSGAGTDAGAYYTQNRFFCINFPVCDREVGTGSGVRVMAIDLSNTGMKGAQSTVFSVAANALAPTQSFMALRAGAQFVSGAGGLTVRVNSLSPNSTNPTSASVTVTTGAWTGSNPAPAVDRIWGPNRFSTSAEIAKKFVTADVVYVANGRNYPDALSAAPAASFANAPLLLTEATSLPSVIADQIKRLNPSRIVVVGGTAVISASVEAALEALYAGQQVDRIAGGDRYETSREITADAFLETPPNAAVPTPTAFIATGRNFPDALSASAAADSLSAPLILVDGTASGIDSATRDLLDALGVEDVYIAGGFGVVSTGIESSLNSSTGILNVERLAGADRYSTSVAINSLFAAPTFNAYIANGTGFADALSGTALAGRFNAPLYVVPGSCVPQSMLDQLDSLAVTDVFLVGGESALTASVYNLIPCQ